jgi:hypothetical protein
VIAAVIVLAGLVAVLVWDQLEAARDMRALRARIAALESRTDAAQRWQDEVRKAIAAGR